MYKDEQRPVFSGVCAGIANKLNIEPFLVRAFFVISTLFFFVGAIYYIILAFSLPKESEVSSAYEAKFLGVCSRIATKFNFDIGLTRSLFAFCLLTSLVPSFGTTAIIYFVLHFVFDHFEDLPRPTHNQNYVDVKFRDIN